MRPDDSYYRRVARMVNAERDNLPLPTPRKPTSTRSVARLLGWIIATAAAVLALTYVADYIFAQARSKKVELFGSVVVQRSYAIPQKSGRTEYKFDEPQAQQCIRSIFPHFGYMPCWYLEKHKDQQVNL